MPEIGVALASEDWGPRELVELARSAEEAGFEYAFISDHYHPWVDAQGSSPFVWSVIGGIAEATGSLRLATGVTCPLIRIHPAIIAQAAATAACLMERTAANAALFAAAKREGAKIGLDLKEAPVVGGASDGNTTNVFTPTLDGLGPVGAGAHAADEHILVSRTLKRTALLALLLLLPPFSAHAGSRASHALVGRAV